MSKVSSRRMAVEVTVPRFHITVPGLGPGMRPAVDSEVMTSVHMGTVITIVALVRSAPPELM